MMVQQYRFTNYSLFLCSSLRFSTDSLMDRSFHISTDLLGYTGGNIMADVLQDGGSRSAVLGGHLGSDGHWVSHCMSETVSVIRVSLGISLSIDMGDHSRPHSLHILTDGVLMSSDRLAHHHGLRCTLGFSMTRLTHNNSLSDNLADRQHYRGMDIGSVGYIRSVAIAIVWIRISIRSWSWSSQGDCSKEGNSECSLHYAGLRLPVVSVTEQLSVCAPM